MTKSILVTGGAGFIGSNFVPYFCKKYPEYHIINLDKLTYAGDLNNVKECEKDSNYTFVKGDICDEKLIEELFTKYDIRGVIHFAAESHVDNSIKGPKIFMETNIMGTFTLIETARRHWMDAPFKVQPGCEIVVPAKMKRKMSVAETMSLGSSMSSIAAMIATIANLSK